MQGKQTNNLHSLAELYLAGHIIYEDKLDEMLASSLVDLANNGLVVL